MKLHHHPPQINILCLVSFSSHLLFYRENLGEQEPDPEEEEAKQATDSFEKASQNVEAKTKQNKNGNCLYSLFAQSFFSMKKVKTRVILRDFEIM